MPNEKLSLLRFRADFAICQTNEAVQIVNRNFDNYLLLYWLFVYSEDDIHVDPRFVLHLDRR